MCVCVRVCLCLIVGLACISVFPQCGVLDSTHCVECELVHCVALILYMDCTLYCVSLHIQACQVQCVHVGYAQHVL